MRVSAADQKQARQRVTIGDVDRLFSEKISGKSKDGRAQLKEILAHLRGGGKVRVKSPDRLARSTTDLLALVEQLKSKSVAFEFVDNPALNMDTPQGESCLPCSPRSRCSNGRRSASARPRASPSQSARVRTTVCRTQLGTKSRKHAGTPARQHASTPARQHASTSLTLPGPRAERMRRIGPGLPRAGPRLDVCRYEPIRLDRRPSRFEQ